MSESPDIARFLPCGCFSRHEFGGQTAYWCSGHGSIVTWAFRKDRYRRSKKLLKPDTATRRISLDGVAQ